MKEIICINIGQAGIQMANAIWELFCQEHGITADGKMRSGLTDGDSRAFNTFFFQSPSDQYVPRVLSIDLEPTVVDEIRTGTYRQLFHPDSLINGEEDAASNFARGHFTIGKSIIDVAMAQLRKVVDNCDGLEGFLMISSYGGGTGSGFQTLMLEKIGIEYAKRLKISVVIYPCPKLSTSTVEPYNAVLTSHFTLEQGELSVFFDNESMYDICTKTLDINRPTYSNLNRLLAQIYSAITVSLRYESSLNANLSQIVTNLIPYPRIHFSMVNYSPIVSAQRAAHEQFSVVELTRNVFEPGSQLLRVNMKVGKYMSCCLQYRGDITPRAVNEAIFEIKRRTDIKFVDWCPTGFKIGINSQPPTLIPGSGLAPSKSSVTMITNSTAIVTMWENINKKFTLLFNKRAFVHWYVGEGMEEGEFNEAIDNISYLLKDYKEVEMTNDEDLNKATVTNVSHSNIKEVTSYHEPTIDADLGNVYIQHDDEDQEDTDSNI
uniref:Tubulin alpha chain n=1 Tax=Schmidtea polychroa TaxID=50054 RepID=Q7Z1L8_SCHPL|nr:alpha-tubulin [Schmidtea polychroa]